MRKQLNRLLTCLWHKDCSPSKRHERAVNVNGCPIHVGETQMRMVIKSLFVGALFPLAAVVAPGAADAAPCSTTAVAYSIWVTPGFSCTITDTLGTKTFSNFSFASGTGFSLSNVSV